MLKKAAKSALSVVEGILRTPYVDFEWYMGSYQPVFRDIDDFRKDGCFTDEEIGDVLEKLGENQDNKFLENALYAAGAMFKSRLIEFEWNAEQYKPVFDQLNVMRADDTFTDEEFADFIKAVRESL